LSKSSKTSKKKGTTKRTTSTKPKPKKKTGAKAKKTTKKVPTKKKTSAKKTGKKTPTKKSTTRKEKKPPKKKARKAPSKKTVSDNIAMLKELEIEIKSDDEQVSLGAIERLGLLNHPQATRVLIGALSDSRYMIRIHVAVQLGERQDKKSVDALIASFSDDSIFVRQSVAGALENIGGAKAKKAVTQAEKDGILLDELPEGRRLIER
jgi:hypothetical protein